MDDDAAAVATTAGVAQVFDLHALKDFVGQDRLVIMFLKVNPKALEGGVHG